MQVGVEAWETEHVLPRDQELTNMQVGVEAGETQHILPADHELTNICKWELRQGRQSTYCLLITS